jgi:6-phosphogluconolactonase
MLTKVVAANALDAARNCAQRVLQLLHRATTDRGVATLAVSGGSTPKPMFADLARSGFDWKTVHLFFVDERMVPPNDEQSNYKLAYENLIAPGGIPMENVHRVQGELEPETSARMYETELRQFFRISRGQFPVFDVMHFGMGDEGHTASLFPGDPNVEDRKGLTAAVYAPKLPNLRVTLLPGVLLTARHSLMLVAGADKNPVLRRAIQGEYNPLDIPVQIVARAGGGVEWFLDEAAAEGL